MGIAALALLARVRSAAPWALRHLVFSVVIAGLVALLIIGAWFPPPFVEISGGLSLFALITVVDVVCGPALTLLLLHPTKSRKALWTDIVLISAIQLSALGFGVHTLSQARPIALVFEVDRIRVVSYADLDMSHPEMIPGWVQPWGFAPPRMLGVRTARTAAEKWDSVDASLQGIEPSQRPDWWQDYALNVPQIKARAKPLELLLAIQPQMRQRILAAASLAARKQGEQETARAEDLLWLPVVSRRSMDWVAFIDPYSARIRGYVKADGFGF